MAVMVLSRHRVLSSKTVRPRDPCGARCMEHAIRAWSAVCSGAPYSQFDEGARPQLHINEWNFANTSSQTIELNPSCWGQAYSNRPGTVSGYESIEPGCILVVVRIPSMICPLRSVDAKSGKVV